MIPAGALSKVEVLLPQLTPAGFALREVPIQLEVPTKEASPSSGALLGLEILRRFNTIIDYPHRIAYFKPNKQFKDPFQER